jgi:ABC-2 type transport system permease protein
MPWSDDAPVIDRLAGALGIDGVQWRALVRTYLRMDFRATGGPAQRSGSPRGRSQITGIAIVGVIGGAAFAVVAAATADLLLSASLLTTYAAATTMMMLLVDFTGVVLAPEDYAILAPRPVSSRTYFAARLSAIGAYVSVLSLATAALPIVVFGVKGGALAGAAALAAVLLCDLCTTVLVISAYVTLLRWVHPSKLKRAMAYAQLAGATTFYVAYYLATVGFRHAFLDRLGFEGSPWMWIVPSTWFAALVRVAAGGAGAATWIAASAALALALVCVPLASGRLSLDYARRVGEMSAVAEPAVRRRFRLPGFSRDEARAVALLVRAQFRFDQRFRMGILGIIPLTGFYLLLGLEDGVLRDPFLGSTGGPGVYFAVMFIPMTLHTALAASESWRAAWIFFATPASHARIVVAAKNFVTVYFLGAYVLLLAAFWSWFYERVWHAVVHALILGMLAHLLLQLAVITRPSLPFAAEPHKAQRSATMFAVFLVGGLVAGIFPGLLTIVYRSAAATAGTIGFLAVVTVAVEYALRLRVDEAIGQMEFRV